MSGDGVINPADLTPVIEDIADVQADVTDIHHAVQHVTSIFPSDTNLTCTFIAHANANTWSAWAEIVDSAATKLSSAFATCHGHITAMGIETLSEADAIYMIEIAWGAAKNLITSGRFAGATKFQSPTEHLRFWAPAFPVGELIYYRMKTDTAVADTTTIHFRYHCD